MKATVKNAHCVRVIIPSNRIGFGALVMGGFKLVKRVAMYSLADIPW